VKKEEERFEGANLELGGFYRDLDKLSNAIIVGDMFDKIFQPDDA
jgi:hypothetical protein